MFNPGHSIGHEAEHQALARFASLNGNLIGYGTWANRPSAPGVNQRYFATDRHLEFEWNGTRWQSTTLFTMELHADHAQPVTTGVTVGAVFDVLRGASALCNAVGSNGGVRVEQLLINQAPSVTQSATTYINWQWLYTTVSGGVSAALTVSGPANSQGQALNTWKGYSIVNTAFDIIDGGFSQIVVNLLCQGSAPVNTSVYTTGSVIYRLYGG